MDNTFIIPEVLESAVSCSTASALAEPYLTDAPSEVLKDDSTSIIELLFTGDKDIGLDI